MLTVLAFLHPSLSSISGESVHIVIKKHLLVKTTPNLKLNPNPDANTNIQSMKQIKLVTLHYILNTQSQHIYSIYFIYNIFIPFFLLENRCEIHGVHAQVHSTQFFCTSSLLQQQTACKEHEYFMGMNMHYLNIAVSKKPGLLNENSTALRTWKEL